MEITVPYKDRLNVFQISVSTTESPPLKVRVYDSWQYRNVSIIIIIIIIIDPASSHRLNIRTGYGRFSDKR